MFDVEDGSNRHTCWTWKAEATDITVGRRTAGTTDGHVGRRRQERQTYLLHVEKQEQRTDLLEV